MGRLPTLINDTQVRVLSVDQEQRHRSVGITLSVATALVVLIDFFIFDITQDVAVGTMIVSFVASFLAVLLCCFSLGFTTIRMSLFATAVLAVILSVWLHGAPSKTRFAFSRSQFEDLVARLHSGNEVDTPMWVGSFHVKKLKHTRSGQICFWTAEHPYGNTGIVYCPGGERPAVNIMLAREICEDWYYVCVD